MAVEGTKKKHLKTEVAATEAAAAATSEKKKGKRGKKSDAKKQKEKEMKNKSKKQESAEPKKESAETSATVDEKAQKLQKEVQKMVIKLRSEGKSDALISIAKKDLKRNFWYNNGGHVSNGGHASKEAPAVEEKEESSEAAAAPADSEKAAAGESAPKPAKSPKAAPKAAPKDAEWEAEWAAETNEQKLDRWVQAKRQKDYRTADSIRSELRAEGIDPDTARPDDGVREKWGAAEGATDSSAKRLKKSDMSTEEWDQWKGTDEYEEQLRVNRGRVHDLVIIPIIWRGRHDKVDVLSICEDIKQVVAQQGVDCWIDGRRHYTPGQKFAHWEHRGVMLRIEIGPDDVQDGVMRLRRAFTPGDYKTVESKRIHLPPAGARALLVTLKEWGLDKIEIERRKGDSDAEEDEDCAARKVRPAAGAAKVGAAAVADEELQGNYAPHVKSAATVRNEKEDKRMTKKEWREQQREKKTAAAAEEW